MTNTRRKQTNTENSFENINFIINTLKDNLKLCLPEVKAIYQNSNNIEKTDKEHLSRILSLFFQNKKTAINYALLELDSINLLNKILAKEISLRKSNQLNSNTDDFIQLEPTLYIIIGISQLAQNKKLEAENIFNEGCYFSKKHSLIELLCVLGSIATAFVNDNFNVDKLIKINRLFSDLKNHPSLKIKILEELRIFLFDKMILKKNEYSEILGNEEKIKTETDKANALFEEWEKLTKKRETHVGEYKEKEDIDKALKKLQIQFKITPGLGGCLEKIQIKKLFNYFILDSFIELLYLKKNTLDVEENQDYLTKINFVKSTILQACKHVFFIEVVMDTCLALDNLGLPIEDVNILYDQLRRVLNTLREINWYSLVCDQELNAAFSDVKKLILTLNPTITVNTPIKKETQQLTINDSGFDNTNTVIITLKNYANSYLFKLAKIYIDVTNFDSILNDFFKNENDINYALIEENCTDVLKLTLTRGYYLTRIGYKTNHLDSLVTASYFMIGICQLAQDKVLQAKNTLLEGSMLAESDSLIELLLTLPIIHIYSKNAELDEDILIKANELIKEINNNAALKMLCKTKKDNNLNKLQQFLFKKISAIPKPYINQSEKRAEVNALFTKWENLQETRNESLSDEEQEINEDSLNDIQEKIRKFDSLGFHLDPFFIQKLYTSLIIDTLYDMWYLKEEYEDIEDSNNIEEEYREKIDVIKSTVIEACKYIRYTQIITNLLLRIAKIDNIYVLSFFYTKIEKILDELREDNWHSLINDIELEKKSAALSSEIINTPFMEYSILLNPTTQQKQPFILTKDTIISTLKTIAKETLNNLIKAVPPPHKQKIQNIKNKFYTTSDYEKLVDNCTNFINSICKNNLSIIELHTQYGPIFPILSFIISICELCIPNKTAFNFMYLHDAINYLSYITADKSIAEMTDLLKILRAYKNLLDDRLNRAMPDLEKITTESKCAGLKNIIHNYLTPYLIKCPLALPEKNQEIQIILDDLEKAILENRAHQEIFALQNQYDLTYNPNTMHVSHRVKNNFLMAIFFFKKMHESKEFVEDYTDRFFAYLDKFLIHHYDYVKALFQLKDAFIKIYDKDAHLYIKSFYNKYQELLENMKHPKQYRAFNFMVEFTSLIFPHEIFPYLGEANNKTNEIIIKSPKNIKPIYIELDQIKNEKTEVSDVQNVGDEEPLKKSKGPEERKNRATEHARLMAEKANQKKAEEAMKRKAAQEEARIKAEEERKRKTEEEKKKTEAEKARLAKEAKEKAEAQNKRKIEEEKKKAEEEKARLAKEAKEKAEAQNKRKIEEEKKKAEAEAEAARIKLEQQRIKDFETKKLRYLQQFFNIGELENWHQFTQGRINLTGSFVTILQFFLLSATDATFLTPLGKLKINDIDGYINCSEKEANDEILPFFRSQGFTIEKIGRFDQKITYVNLHKTLESGIVFDLSLEVTVNKNHEDYNFIPITRGRAYIDKSLDGNIELKINTEDEGYPSFKKVCETLKMTIESPAEVNRYAYRLWKFLVKYYDSNIIIINEDELKKAKEALKRDYLTRPKNIHLTIYDFIAHDALSNSRAQEFLKIAFEAILESKEIPYTENIINGLIIDLINFKDYFYIQNKYVVKEQINLMIAREPGFVSQIKKLKLSHQFYDILFNNELHNDIVIMHNLKEHNINYISPFSSDEVKSILNSVLLNKTGPISKFKSNLKKSLGTLYINIDENILNLLIEDILTHYYNLFHPEKMVIFMEQINCCIAHYNYYGMKVKNNINLIKGIKKQLIDLNPLLKVYNEPAEPTFSVVSQQSLYSSSGSTIYVANQQQHPAYPGYTYPYPQYVQPVQLPIHPGYAYNNPYVSPPPITVIPSVTPINPQTQPPQVYTTNAARHTLYRNQQYYNNQRLASPRNKPHQF